MTSQDIASILAGLGLFFVGIKQLSSFLKQLAGPGVRELLGRMSGHPLLAGIWGVFIGFVVQSGRVTSMLLASLVSSGALPVRRALPTSFWSNFGCSLIVVAAVLPMKIVVMVLIGLAGVMFAFDILRDKSSIFGALFSLALFMFGLSLVKDGADGLLALDSFSMVMAWIQATSLFTLLLGMVLTIVAQSHMGVIMIGVTMTATGVLSLHDTVMLIYGTQLGSSVVTYLFSVKLFRGRARQVVMAQVVFNIIGVVFFVALYYIESYLDIPLMIAMVQWLSDDVATQAAIVAIVFNFVTALICHLGCDPIQSLLDRLWPITEHEELGQAQYINPAAIAEPEVALILVRKEQRRLLAMLPKYMEVIRPAQTPSKLELSDYHRAFDSVSEDIHRFSTRLVGLDLSISASEQLLLTQSRQSRLITLESDLHELSARLSKRPDSDALQALQSSITEATDTLLLTLVDAVENRDQDDMAMLLSMTDASHQTLRDIRQRHLEQKDSLTPDQRQWILYTTHGYDRVASGVRHLVQVTTDLTALDQADAVDASF